MVLKNETGMLTIENILTADEVTALRDLVEAGDAAFADGGKTAGWHARGVKRNEQLDPKVAAAVATKVEAALRANDVFMAAARPRNFVKVLVSRYREGMEYGNHVDDAMMNGMRTDMSFTLFLSAPGDCEGGELIVDAPGGELAVKEEPGSVFVYPSTTLHRVAPVTKGERLVVVGWVRSLVRRADERDILFELDNAIVSARADGASRATLDRLLKVKNNLIRLWAED
jgi:PKHD-type hydroxylase